MKDLIWDEVLDICDEENIDIDKLPYDKVLELHIKANNRVVNRMVDEADNLRKAERENYV